MKKVIFTGCSFTHAPDSWAHLSNPWIHEQSAEGFNPNLKQQKEKEMNSYTHIEFRETTQTKDHLEEQYLERCKVYGEEKSFKFQPHKILNGVQRLPSEHYQIHILGSGANSNIDNVRKVIHFVENDIDYVDTIIFQITSDNRANAFRKFDKGLEPTTNPSIEHEFSFTKYDDIWFEKINEVENKLIASRIYSIESLQQLTLFAKANNITLKFFHGWDNFDKNNAFEYVIKKYKKYVEPNLLTDTNIIDYATNFCAPQDVFQHNDLHPSSLSHKLFWNNVIYPFLKK